MAKKALSYKILRIDGNPESHSSTVDIFLFSINKIHWNIKSIINILLKPAIRKREVINALAGKHKKHSQSFLLNALTGYTGLRK